MPLDVDAVKAKLDKLEQETSRTEFEYWKPKTGDNNIRILDADPWVVETGYHYEVGPKEETVTCPKLTDPAFGGRDSCSLCDFVSKLRKSGKEGNAEDKELAGDLASSRRYFTHVIDLNEPEKGVQVFAFGVMIYKAILGLITHPDYGADLIDHKKGFDLILKKTGKDRDTEYQLNARRNPSSVYDLKKFDTEQLKNMTDLSKVPNILTNEEIMAVYEGKGTARKSKDEDENTDESSHDHEEKDDPETQEVSWDLETAESLKGSDDVPKCYSKEFDPKDSTCKVCDFKEPCSLLVEVSKPKEEPKKEDKPAKKTAAELLAQLKKGK